MNLLSKNLSKEKIQKEKKMKLLSSFLIAAYANTVDERECHAIDNHGNYRKFAAKSADVAGTHTALELVSASAGDDDTDGVPNCLAECDNNEKCLFVVHTTGTNTCDMAQIKADQSETIFNR